MLTRFFSLVDSTRGSLWFVPSAMTVAAVALAFTTLWIDQELIGSTSTDATTWLYGGGADGARDVLSTVASSMITVAGVIFSVTVVALTLASQQFGPRLLRNFMRDPGNQFVLGTFISVHLFCLIVLRAVRTEAAGGFVPHLSVSVALILAVAAAAVLIYFFHHATSSIRASAVIAAVAEELDGAIDRLFPEPVGRPGPLSVVQTEIERAGTHIRLHQSGYLQAVDMDSLVSIAKTHDLVMRLDRRPGDFITCECVVASVWPAERLSKDIAEQLNEAFLLGDERTAVQDLLFPAQQLAEMAVRALSPGTNDPSTALACVDRLGAAFIRLAARQVPSPYRYDDDHRLRITADPVMLQELIAETFNPIRQYGRTSVAVTVRLLETIALSAPHVTSREGLAELQRQAIMIQRGSHGGLLEEWDRQVVEERFTSVETALARRRAA